MGQEFRYSRNLSRGNRFAIDIRRTAAAGIGKSKLPELCSGIIEIQNFFEGLVIIACHGLRAALAHAHAVSIAPEDDRIAILRFRHFNGFIAAGIDRQRIPGFKPVIGGDVGRDHGIAALARKFADGTDAHGKAQRLIQAAGFIIFGIAGFNGRNRNDAYIFSFAAQIQCGQLVGHSCDERSLQFVLQVIRVPGNFRGLCAGTGVFQIVGVILHQAVCQLSAPDVGRGFGLAAVGRGIIAADHGTSIIERLSAGFVHGANHIGIAGIVTAKYLVAGGVGHVIALCAAGSLLPQRIIARGHRLRLERLQREGVRHFIGHDAVKVIFDVNVENGDDRIARCGKIEVAAENIRKRRRRKFRAAVAAGCAQQARRCAGIDADAAAADPHFAVLSRYCDAGTAGDVHGRIPGEHIPATGGKAYGRLRAQSGKLHAYHAVRSRICIAQNGHAEACHQRKNEHQAQRAPKHSGYILMYTSALQFLSYLISAKFAMRRSLLLYYT